MQVHPLGSDSPIKDTVESISAGYIGLDFSSNAPDLMTIPKGKLKSHKNYWAFAHEMKIGDRVLVFAHNFPLALVQIKGEYNYIRSIDPEIGVWFRHFREIDDVRYYWDYVESVNEWENIPMSGTIAPLRNPKSQSYRLIERWLGIS
jgi:hypothetical protein